MYHICFAYIHQLNGYRELNSFEEPWFTLVATITSFARELNPTGVGEHIYIVIHRQTVSFYQNSSVWLDRLDSRSWDWKLADCNANPRFYHSVTRKPYIYIHTNLPLYCVCVCVCMSVFTSRCMSSCVWSWCLVNVEFGKRTAAWTDLESCSQVNNHFTSHSS